MFSNFTSNIDVNSTDVKLQEPVTNSCIVQSVTSLAVFISVCGGGCFRGCMVGEYSYIFNFEGRSIIL